MPADILGQVYERFLGKVIELSESGLARVEDKPEVRKAGGVYYTPTYIVDYIVENTVGKLLDGKTPKDVEKLRILDPACGSGSFLTGALSLFAGLASRLLQSSAAAPSGMYLRRRVDGYCFDYAGKAAHPAKQHLWRRPGSECGRSEQAVAAA